MRESAVLREVWLAVSRHCVLFRLNTGMAVVSNGGKPRRMPNGDIVCPGGQFITLGFGMPNGKPLVGASDLIGWTRKVVTADMVGKPVLIFTAIECKRTTGGKVSPEQKTFIENVLAAGGIAGHANSAGEALKLFDGRMF